MRLVLSILTLVALADSAGATSVTFDLQSKLTTGTRAVTLQLTPVRNSSAVDVAKPAVTREVALDEAPLSLDLAPGVWALDVEGAEVWHARQFFVVAGAPVHVTAEVSDAGRVRGKASIARAGAPSRIELWFASGPEWDRVRSAAKCHIDEGVFDCRMPAGTFDLRLKCDACVARHVWDKVVEPAKTLDLGAIEFVTGASVIGRVAIGPSVPRGAIARVTAKPVGSREPLLTLQARVHAKGLFQFEGVAPGRYQVRATAGKARSQPVEIDVLPRVMAELSEPLRVELPQPVRVRLEPPLDPSGGRWNVALDTGVPDVRRVAHGQAAPDGQWTSEPLEAGTYHVVVETADGSTWLMQSVTVAGEPAEVQLALPMHRIEGKVTYADRPLAAELTFRDGNVELRGRSDEEGHYAMALPRRENARWTVRVKTDAPPMRRTLTFDVAGADHDIDVPATMVSGVVVDADGTRVPNALVNVRGAEDNSDAPMQVTADATGAFTIAGLAPGKRRLSAASFLRQSPTVTIDVADGEPVEHVQLVLKDDQVLTGRVLSAFGPVAGARVIASATNVDGAMSYVEETNGRGEFSTVLPGDAREIDVEVAAPGFAYKLVHTSVRNGVLTLSVEQRGGTLIVPRPAADLQPYLLRAGAVAHASGAAFHGTHGREEPSRYVLTNVEIGPYALCAIRPAEVPALRAGLLRERCVSGFVAPGGTLELKLQAP